VALFADELRDPVTYAIPFFVLFMALEFFSMRYLEDDERDRGYEPRDSRTNIWMGLGSLVVNGGARVVELLGY
jgi:hypothetical protein